MLRSFEGQLVLPFALALLTPTWALAQEAAPASSPQAAEPGHKMQLSVPPPPPPMARQARVHNGFYLRGAFGAGGMWPQFLDRSENTTDAKDRDGGGFVLEMDALVGGSPADGFAVGGGLFLNGGRVNLRGDESLNTNVGLFMVGPFFDAFPDPKGGWHLGALVGFAGHRVLDHPSGIETTQGFGGSAWFGYDWWVSHELSAGAMLKFNGAITSADDGDAKLRASSTGLTVLLTALYH